MLLGVPAPSLEPVTASVYRTRLVAGRCVISGLAVLLTVLVVR